MPRSALCGHFEHRSPLGTRKLLTYVAYLSAHHWELAEALRRAVASLPSAARAQVEPGLDSLQAAIALQAAFVDQSAMDGGRYGLSWLLVGLPQPPFATIRQHVERQGEEPFSPLVDPRWIAANLAYLRDLDYLVHQEGPMVPPGRRFLQDNLQRRFSLIFAFHVCKWCCTFANGAARLQMVLRGHNDVPWP